MSDSGRFSKHDLEYMPTDLLQQSLSGVGLPIIDSPNKGVHAAKTHQKKQKQTVLAETMSNDDLISEIAKFQAEIQSSQSLMQKLQKNSQKHGNKSKKEQHHQVEKMAHASHKHGHKLTKHIHHHQLVQKKMRHHKQKLSKHLKKHMHRSSKHHKMKVHKRHAAKHHHHKKVGPVSKHHHDEHKAHLKHHQHGVHEPKKTSPPMNYKAGSPISTIKHSVPDVKQALPRLRREVNKVAIQKQPIKQQSKKVNIPAVITAPKQVVAKAAPVASPKVEMEKYMADKKAQNKLKAAPAAKPAPAQPKPVKEAVAAPVVKKNVQPADIRKSESFMSKVQDIQKTINKKHIAVKSHAKKSSGFSLMKALGGKKKAAPSPVVKVDKPDVAPASMPTAVPIPVSNKGHLELTRDSIKAKEQKEKEVVKEEDMAYSIDAITDYGANLNSIHDKYQTKFSADGKKDDRFGINDIEVSTLDDEETPQKKTVEIKAVVQKPTAPPAAPKPAAPVVAPKPVVLTVEQPKSTPGGKLVASLVEPATTTVEAGGLKIEVSSLEDLD